MDKVSLKHKVREKPHYISFIFITSPFFLFLFETQQQIRPDRPLVEQYLGLPLH